MSEAEKFMIANVEALTSNENGEENINPYYEAGYFYCRCKENSEGVKGCYGGNAISLKANCYKGISAIHCNKFDSNCVN